LTDPSAATFRDRLIDKLLMALVVGTMAWGVRYLERISEDVAGLKSTLSIAVEQVSDLRRRVEVLEARPSPLRPGRP